MTLALTATVAVTSASHLHILPITTEDAINVEPLVFFSVSLVRLVSRFLLNSVKTFLMAHHTFFAMRAV